MTVDLNPDLEQFVKEQVRTGKFSSPREVFEAGLARLMLDQQPDVLDDKDLARIRVSIDEMQRGSTLDWKVFSESIRDRMSNG